MGEVSNKQIVINTELHRRLRIHVATLGIPSIKQYVETLIEHAIATTSPPEMDVDDAGPEIPTEEPEQQPDPTVITTPPVIQRPDDRNPDEW